MNDVKVLIDSFTVSSNFDTHRGGEKSAHFVSVSVKLDPPVSFDDFSMIQLHAAHRVSIAAIHDALMRGAMSIEEANDRIRNLKENYESLSTSLEKKRREADALKLSDGCKV